MSWFKRGVGSKAAGDVKSASPSPLRSGSGRSMMTSTPARNTSESTQDLPPTSPIARRQLRMDTDPETCSEVFRSHWSQVLAIMGKGNNASPSINVKRTAQEDVEAVLRYVDQMMLLLVEEEAQDGGQGPVLEFLLTEDILDRLLVWSSQHVEHSDQLRLHQLKLYDQLITLARQDLVIHKPVIRPLLKLLASCQDHPNKDVEHYLVLLLHQLCVCVTQNKYILELLFDSHADHGPAKFLVFSLLITYIHREGDIGQQARDALLLIMSLSYIHDDIGRYIAQNSDFCPVLATGLSGLYSSLPRKLEYPSDDWYRLANDDVTGMPELIMFLNSLEFCNAVVQVAHSLVRDQLLVYIYTGFLVPVLGPALHQDIFKLPISLIESYFATSMEEVIAATAYLDLFIRRVTEPALIRTFLKFILTGKHDDMYILDSLVTRISSNSRLCMVTLSLFRTLIELNCEDVMFQLVFKYLIPCSHVMVSQRRAVKNMDMYGKTAEKLLSLRPACCTTATNTATEYPTGGDGTQQNQPGDGTSTTLSTDSSVTSSSTTPDTTTGGSGSNTLLPQQQGSSSTGTGSATSAFESSYLEYLQCVRQEIEHCAKACQCWTFPYDGDIPPIDSLASGVMTPTTFPTTDVLGLTKSSPDKPVVQNGLPDGHKNNNNNIDKDSSPPQKPSSQELAKKRRSYAESVASDVDSAFSGSSAHTDTLHNSVCGQISTSPSRGDSPLSDNFDNADFGAFLLSLKRVQTPVEYCDTIEDSFNEIESMANELKQASSAGTKRSSSKASSAPQSPSELSDDRDMPKFTDQMLEENSSNIVKPVPNIPDESNNSKHSSISNDQASEQTDLDSSLMETSQIDRNKTVRCPSPLLTPLKQTGNPNIGPFLSTLLGRLEQMMQNTLYVNLLLTGVLTRLACFSQPLIRSFLLNHTLVFQPTVKSLIQVLSSVKQKVDCFALTVRNFDDMLVKARHFLLWREEVYLRSIGETSGRRDSNSSFPGALCQPAISPEPHKEKNRSFRDIFRRNQPSPVKSSRSNEPRLRLLGDKQGFRYINQKSPPATGDGNDTMSDQLEALKTKNAVYCALVLDEFLKELAAISQEHPVCSV